MPAGGRLWPSDDDGKEDEDDDNGDEEDGERGTWSPSMRLSVDTNVLPSTHAGDDDDGDDEDGELGTWSPFMRVSVDARRGVLAFSDHCPDNYDGI